MAVIKGQNLRILAGTSASNLKCIAAAQSCTMHVAVAFGDAASKDDEKGWAENEPLGLNWDVQVEALIVTNDTDDDDTDDDDDDTAAIVAEDLTVGQTYLLRMSRTSTTANTKNRSQLTDRLRLTGNAVLSDLQLVAQNRGFSTWTAKFTGDGALTQYTPT